MLHQALVKMITHKNRILSWINTSLIFHFHQFRNCYQILHPDFNLTGITPSVTPDWVTCQVIIEGWFPSNIMRWGNCFPFSNLIWNAIWLVFDLDSGETVTVFFLEIEIKWICLYEFQWFVTHLPLDKMATISQMHFLECNVWILMKISLKFVPKGPIDNNQAFV